jgi:hypothetical protein
MDAESAEKEEVGDRLEISSGPVYFCTRHFRSMSNTRIVRRILTPENAFLAGMISVFDVYGVGMDLPEPPVFERNRAKRIAGYWNRVAGYMRNAADQTRQIVAESRGTAA